MKPVNPQRGNPHRLVVNQHIFPIKSIDRFRDNKGLVEVYYKRIGKRLRLKSNNTIFCAKRKWDQRAELGYMKSIEDAFQSLASEIIKGDLNQLKASDNWIATNFHALWNLRHSHHIHPSESIELIGIDPGKELTIDEEEILETKGYIVSSNQNSKAIVQSRFVNGLNIQTAIDMKCAAMKNLKWGIIHSARSEFIVPDTFGDFAIIPISPTVILLGDSDNLIITSNEVFKVNQIAVQKSHEYYFARNLAYCPV